MGTADRDYFRDEARRYSGAQQPAVPQVTKWLLVANIAIFVLDLLITNGALANRFAFRIGEGLLGGHLWQFITFQFLHADAGHLIFNMFNLWLFGRWVETWWGSRRFIVFYLPCGIAGPLFFALLNAIGILNYGPVGNLVPMVGASAGIYGCMMAAAMIDPQARLQFMFLPWTFTVRRLALILLGVAVFFVLLHFLGVVDRNAGGEAAHLGGALAAYGMMRFPQLLRRGTGPEDSSKIVRPKEFRRKKPRNPGSRTSSSSGSAPSPNAKLKPRTTLDTTTASEVDRILDKINREGLQSLTAKEQEILNEAGRSRRDR